MSDATSTVLGILAVLGIPLASWLSKRASREGRLLLRIQRLGNAYSVIPDSPAKEEFKKQVVDVVADFNSWMEADRTRARRAIAALWVVSSVIGLIAVVLSAALVQKSFYPLAGVLIGFVLSGVAQLGTYLIERRTRKLSEAKQRAVSDEKSARRLEALRRGEL